jgi:murein DD-endopeptidase MepM/ murein hydrolase activator NlpD
MQEAAYESRLARGALTILALGLLFGAGGCSSGVSRFDYPSFNLTGSHAEGSQGAANVGYAADPATTASLPVPEESVYASNASEPYSQPSPVAQNDPPPPPASAPARTYTPRVTPASYGPPPQPYGQTRSAAYRAPAPVRPEPAVVRTETPRGSANTVKVEKGESLGSIAKRHGVTVEALRAANHLSDNHISVGQMLIIPQGGATLAENEPAPAQRGDAKTYKVEKGDTPRVIARKLGVSEKALIAGNKLKPQNLQVGQELTVPGKETAPVEMPSSAPIVAANEPAAPKAEPTVHVVRTTPIPAPGASTPSPIAASPETTGPAAATPVASVDQLPAPDPMSGNSFRWPVQGRIISAFGARSDGGHNDGINVAVPQGTSVKAAENGVVAYAGSELKGYGNLVLIRHSNNWVSAYAHNEEILVKRGDKVRRGQIIAKAGNTGSVNQPQVHFELRKGSRPVDPTKYMSQTSASAD